MFLLAGSVIRGGAHESPSSFVSPREKLFSFFLQIVFVLEELVVCLCLGIVFFPVTSAPALLVAAVGDIGVLKYYFFKKIIILRQCIACEK